MSSQRQSPSPRVQRPPTTANQVDDETADETVSENEGRRGSTKRARSEPAQRFRKKRQASEVPRRLPAGHSWIEEGSPFVPILPNALQDVIDIWLIEQSVVYVRYHYRCGRKRVAVEGYVRRSSDGTTEIVVPATLNKPERSYAFPHKGIDYEGVKRDLLKGQFRQPPSNDPLKR